jgi:hypothetical protein
MPNVYIVAPLTNQTMIPLLHAHLANIISSSEAAMEMLKTVKLLQYFDFVGLAESIAEISESVYSQKTAGYPSPATIYNNKPTSYVLIQGVASTLSVTSRQSGLVQANALLAGLLRNISELSRASSDVHVMVEAPVEVDDLSGKQQDPTRTKTSRGIQLDSAFAGPSGETLRLACGHETLSRTLEEGLDCLVVVHGGLGRSNENKGRNATHDQVVEVIKDGSGDLTGRWDLWKEG